jgi:hypothetical protein
MALRQLKCRKRFDAAWSLFTEPDRALLALVLLANQPGQPIGARLGLRLPLAMQRLIDAVHTCARRARSDRNAPHRAGFKGMVRAGSSSQYGRLS